VLSVSALPCKTGNTEITPFHFNVVCSSHGLLLTRLHRMIWCCCFLFWYTGFYVDVDIILSVHKVNALYILLLPFYHINHTTKKVNCFLPSIAEFPAFSTPPHRVTFSCLALSIPAKLFRIFLSHIFQLHSFDCTAILCLALSVVPKKSHRTLTELWFYLRLLIIQK